MAFPLIPVLVGALAGGGSLAVLRPGTVNNNGMPAWQVGALVGATAIGAVLVARKVKIK